MQRLLWGWRSTLVFSVALLIIIAGGICVLAQEQKQEQEKPPPTRHGQFVMPSDHQLAGKVFYLESGAKPAPKARVRVWSFEKNKYVYETEAGEDGAYKLPKLDSGNYVIVFGDHVRVDMRVVSGKKPVMEFLHVTIPREKSSVSPDTLAKEFAAEGKPSYKKQKE